MANTYTIELSRSDELHRPDGTFPVVLHYSDYQNSVPTALKANL